MPRAGLYPLKYAVVNAATAATAEIVPAVSGRAITVVNWTLVLAGDVTVTWKSGSTAISGPLAPGAAAVIDATGSPESPLMQTAEGAALNLTLGAAVQVGGTVTYIEENL
jgi:hypothetical protein